MAFVNTSTKVRKARCLDPAVKAAALKYFEIAVRTVCNADKQDWFAARDLVGKHNKNWGPTDLQDIYSYYRSRNAKTAYNEAAKTAGRILMEVIECETRRFETKVRDRARHYRWVKY